MTEPAKCWIDPRGMVFVLMYPQLGDTPAIAMPLRLAERLVNAGDFACALAPAELDTLRTLIREMREEA